MNNFWEIQKRFLIQNDFSNITLLQILFVNFYCFCVSLIYSGRILKNDRIMLNGVKAYWLFVSEGNDSCIGHVQLCIFRYHRLKY